MILTSEKKLRFACCLKLQLNEAEKIVKVEFFLDRGELLGGLIKDANPSNALSDEAASSCPFMKNTS